MAVLQACLDTAWAKYESVFRSELPLCSARGTANIMYELVTQQVRERFAGVDGVVVRDNTNGGRFLVEIDQRLNLSFKKLSKDFLTTNNPTETSIAFDNQEPGLEGMSDLPRVTVGYQLGQYGTSIAGTWLAFVIGRQCVWNRDLQTGAGSIEIEFPRDDRSAADREREASSKGRKLRLLKDGTGAPVSGKPSPDDDPEVTQGG